MKKPAMIQHSSVGQPQQILKRNFKQKPLGIVTIVLVMLLLILLVGIPRLEAATE